MFRGTMRINPHRRHQGYTTLSGLPVDVLFDGLEAQNRTVSAYSPGARLRSPSLAI